MADITIGDAYALGLIARKYLSEAEADMIGSLARPMLREPFSMLKNDFDRVWAQSDKESEFARLPMIGVSAIEFGALEEAPQLKVPTSILKHSQEMDALRRWSRDKLEAVLRDEFWSLIAEHWVTGADQREEALEAA